MEKDEYISEVTEAAGISVVVHSQDTMAYPSDHSTVIAPGFQTHVALTRVNILLSSSNGDVARTKVLYTHKTKGAILAPEKEPLTHNFN